MHDADTHSEKTRAALASIATAVILTTLKLGVGIYTGSLGMLSEALHSGFDLLAAAVTFLAVYVAEKPADKGHAYGHGKIENLAALLETLFLLLTCGWIIFEAVDRLFYNPVMVMPSLWGVAVMGISMLLDIHRVRLLRRVAQKYKSQALEADALHFSTDILSSFVVLVGLLCLWGAQFLPQNSSWRSMLQQADAVAALGVSVIVLFACYSLAKRAIDDLMDSGDADMADAICQKVSAVQGVQNISSLRLRTSGAHSFIDMRISVAAQLNVDQGHHVAHLAEDEIQKLLPGADVTIHVDPATAQQGDTYIDVIHNAAALRDIHVHGVHLWQEGTQTRVELHAEMAGDLSLTVAHQQVTDFEAAVQKYIPNLTIVSHLEPQGAYTPEYTHTLCSAIETEQLTASIAAQMKQLTGVYDCHSVCAYYQYGNDDSKGLTLSFHCRMAGETTVAHAHATSAQLERLLRVQHPLLARIVIHTEPR